MTIPTITPETTLGELEAILRQHKVRIAMSLPTTPDLSLRRKLRPRSHVAWRNYEDDEQPPISLDAMIVKAFTEAWDRLRYRG